MASAIISFGLIVSLKLLDMLCNETPFTAVVPVVGLFVCT